MISLLKISFSEFGTIGMVTLCTFSVIFRENWIRNKDNPKTRTEPTDRRERPNERTIFFLVFVSVLPSSLFKIPYAHFV